MVRVSVTHLTAGQRLARPVVTSTGVALLRPGAQLTATLIARLAGFGLEEVWVEGPAAPADPQPTLEEDLARLDARFAEHVDNPLMVDLRDAIARQIVERHHAHASHD